jgi:hypothetical protein
MTAAPATRTPPRPPGAAAAARSAVAALRAEANAAAAAARSAALAPRPEPEAPAAVDAPATAAPAIAELDKSGQVRPEPASEPEPEARRAPAPEPEQEPEPVVVPVVVPRPAPVPETPLRPRRETSAPRVPAPPIVEAPPETPTKEQKNMSTETFVIGADGKPTLVDHSGHRGGHGHFGPDWQFADVKNSVIYGTDTTKAAIYDNTSRVKDAVNYGADTTKAAICGAVEKGQEQFASLSRQASDVFGVTSKQVSDAATATVVGFKDSLAVNYQIEGRALLEAAKNASAISVQSTAEANALAVQATANFNALNVEMVKNASAAELRAQQIAAAAAAQLAECCCEMKLLQKDTLTAILADGQKTRDLINGNSVQELRDKIVDLQRLIPVVVAK